MQFSLGICKYAYLLHRTGGAIAIHSTHRFYGKEKEPAIIRDVGCEGSEDELGMCPMSWGISLICVIQPAKLE